MERNILAKRNNSTTIDNKISGARSTEIGRF